MSDYREQQDVERWERMLDDEYAPARVDVSPHSDFLAGGLLWTADACPVCWMQLQTDGSCFFCDHGCWRCGGRLSKHDNSCAGCGEVTFRCRGVGCHCHVAAVVLEEAA